EQDRRGRRTLAADAVPVSASPPRTAPDEAARVLPRGDRRADRPAREQRSPHPLRAGAPSGRAAGRRRMIVASCQWSVAMNYWLLAPDHWQLTTDNSCPSLPSPVSADPFPPRDRLPRRATNIRLPRLWRASWPTAGGAVNGPAPRSSWIGTPKSR